MSNITKQDDYYVLITVVLPVCLHLDTRVFVIQYEKDTKIEITTENFFSNKETYMGSSPNMEVISDSFSHFRFTRVTIKIPHFGKVVINPGEIIQMYEKIFFKTLNDFIDSVRMTLRRYGLKNYKNFAEFQYPVQANPSDVINSMGEGIRVATVIFGNEGLTSARPLISDKEHVKIQETLEAGIKLHDIFLADARRELYYGNYLHAILDAVIALEIKISDTIRVIGNVRSVDESSIKSFIKDVGLTGNIKTTLKLLTPPTLCLPTDEVFAKCKSAVTTRNKIMHEGLRDILRDMSIPEIENLINNISLILEFCDCLLNSV